MHYSWVAGAGAGAGGDVVVSDAGGLAGAAVVGEGFAEAASEDVVGGQLDAFAADGAGDRVRCNRKKRVVSALINPFGNITIAFGWLCFEKAMGMEEAY